MRRRANANANAPPLRPRTRRGFTLIELMAVLVVTTALMALAAGMIRLLVRLDRAERDALERSADRARLARDLRDDAHRAVLEPPPAVRPDHLTLTLTLPDGAVAHYEVQPGRVLREVRTGDRLCHREVYRLPPRRSARFAVRSGAGPRRLVALEVVAQAEPSALPDDRITAEVGRWSRAFEESPR